jgi:hypothetical protein
MGGKSDQEKAAEGLFGEISQFDPRVKNRFDQPGAVPFRPSEFLPQFDVATEKGVGTLRRQTEKNVKTAAKGTTAGAQSRGLGGSILEDAVAKARARESEGGTSAINRFLTSRAGQRTGAMSEAQRAGMQLTGAQQAVDLQDIMNMFQKFGLKGTALQGLDPDTWFDDILAIGNVVAEFIPGT